VPKQTRNRFKPTFTSNYTFQQKINKLHTGAQWECKIIKTTGDLQDEDGELLTEDNELWIRDPVECIRELIGNPAFRDYVAYGCQQVFVDKEGTIRRYDEMWTGEWWWKTQVSHVRLATDSDLTYGAYHSSSCRKAPS
jgi:hypothetical protein